MRITAIAAAALVLALGLARLGHADDVSWITGYDDAVKQAKKDGKLVLMDFTGSDWCSWCHKLHDEVFSTKDFQDWAAKKAILLTVDFPKSKPISDDLKKQNNDLQAKFKIKGYPTIVFLDGDGNEKGRTGYVKGGPAEWIKAAEAAIAKGPEAEPKKVEKKEDAAVSSGDASWVESWDKAVAAAKKDKKLILADFTGSDWCGWCIKLHKEVFDLKDFKDWAAKNVVLLELDFPHKKAQTDELKAQNKKLLDKYGVEGFPTILVLDADGKKVGELGYMEGGPAVWTKAAQEILDKNKK